MLHLTETEKAYIAGLFDGEGCVGYYNRDTVKGVKYHSASIHICNSDLRIMTWIMNKVKMGNIITNSSKKHTAYQWQISKKLQVKEFLTAIRPYMVMKADQADLLLNLWHDEQDKGYTAVTPELEQLRHQTMVNIKALKTLHLTGAELG